MVQKREYAWDNLRGLLISLVVLGHILEWSGPFDGQLFWYRTIYSFHMPVFLFLTGYFARFDKNKIIFTLLLPYVIFQTAYLYFDGWLDGDEVVLQYTQPQWLVWYLMVCILYHLLLPLYHTEDRKQQFLALGITFALSLLVGYDQSVGYKLALSRFFVFQPWFLLGYYSRQGNWIVRLTNWSETRKFPIKGLLVLAVCILPMVIQMIDLPYKILYGASSYETLNYGPSERILAAVTALAWIGFCGLVLRPLLQRRIPLLTTLGQNTMPVYLLHGFLVRYLQYRQFWLLETPWKVAMVLLVTLAVCGNPLAGGVFRKVFSGAWLQKKKISE